MNTFVSALITIAVLTVLLVIFAALVMGLWNWLMPMIFGLQTITMLQALGLTMLFNLLFGGTNVIRH